MSQLHYDLSTLIDECVKITDIADAEIRRIYQKLEIACTHKEDCSPLTEADMASHHLIMNALHILTPDIPVVSEEGADKIDPDKLFWLVDPLDGTKEFISKNGEFTVNIALIQNNLPIMGVISAPVLGVTYVGAVGLGARKRTNGHTWNDISAITNADTSAHIIGSKSHGNADVDKWVHQHYPSADFCGIGSSLKFCLIAEGKAHAYPRFGPTMEWDTAAGHAILNAAGGSVTTCSNAPLTYGKAFFKNPHFIARCINAL